MSHDLFANVRALTDANRLLRETLGRSDISRQLQQFQRTTASQLSALSTASRDITEQLRSLVDTARLLQASPLREQLLENQRELDGFMTSVRALADAVPDAVALLTRSDLLGKWQAVQVDQSVFRTARDLEDTFGPLLREPQFAALVAETARLQDLSAQDASDEDKPKRKVRRQLILPILEGALKGYAKIDVNFESVQKKSEFAFALLAFLVSVISSLYNSHNTKLARLDAAESLTIQRSQALTIAALVSAVDEVRDELAPLLTESRETFKTGDWSDLRQGPDGKAAKILTVPPGQLLRLRFSYGRWRFVEVLDERLRDTGIRGWVYRRALRLDRPHR